MILFIGAIFLIVFLGFVFSCFCYGRHQDDKRYNNFKKELKEGQIYKIYTSERDSFICWYIIVINKIQKDSVIYTIYKPLHDLNKTNPHCKGYILNETQYNDIINGSVKKDNIYESNIRCLWDDFIKEYSYDIIKDINNN